MNRFKQIREEYSENRRDKDPTEKIYSIDKMVEEMKEAGFDVSSSRIKKIESEQAGVNISPEILLAYKWKFGVSADWLIDPNVATRNLQGDVATASKITGLSDDSITMLQYWKKQHDTSNKLLHGLGKEIDILNTLLEYQLFITQKASPNYTGWSVFHYIGQYLTPKKMKREQQNLLRICQGKTWKSIELGDIIKKQDGTEYNIQNMEAINKESFTGSDTSKVYLVNDEDSERYSLDIDAVFQSYAKDNIFRSLDKIKEYIKKKEVK